MKASPFAYHRPESRAEALALLAEHENSRILAGGQSLVPMLNMRYAMIEHVIDINRVPGLSEVRLDGEILHVGAMTRQRTIYEDAALRRRAPIFADALRFVGHLQTRNRGTVGGSLAHLDPAAELVGVAALLDATVHVARASAERKVPMAEFPTGYMTPDLAPDEMLTGVSFALPDASHGSAFAEFAQRHGDFAIAGVGAVLEVSPTRGVISDARIVVIGLGSAPYRLSQAERLLVGQSPDPAAFEAAADTARDIEAMTDAMATAAYRRKLAVVLTRRVLAEAAARARRSFEQ